MANPPCPRCQAGGFRVPLGAGFDPYCPTCDTQWRRGPVGELVSVRSRATGT